MRAFIKRKVYYMKKVLIIVLLFLAIFITAYGMRRNQGVRRAVPGIPAPVQKEASGKAEVDTGGYHVEYNYQYSYDIKALVVHTRDYKGGMDFTSKISPKDLALAWGKVAEYNDRIDFGWRQSGRWYFWECDSYEDIALAGGVAGISSCSSNNHIIPATHSVKEDVMKIKTGDYIELKGYLVNVFATKGADDMYYWNSSTTRDDTGDGSCEVFYVTEVNWLK